MKLLSRRQHISERFWLIEYLMSLGLVTAVTMLCEVLRHVLLPVNLLMIYLVTVVVAALNLSLYPSVVAVVLSGFIYNYLYVEPRFLFDFQDKVYLSTFFGLLVTGVAISSLVTKARERAEALVLREEETASLYQLSSALAIAGDEPGIAQAVISNVESSLAARLALLLHRNGYLVQVAASNNFVPSPQEAALAQWSFHSGSAAGCGTERQGTAELMYVPLKTPTKTIGVLAVKLPTSRNLLFGRARRLVESFADQAALALERVELVHETERASSLVARQKLERALLNSVSHDLRTPLATITGVLSSVLEEGEQLSEQLRRELLENARGEADRLNCFVGKLLDITRLEAKGVVLKIEPCDVQELVGCALAVVEQQISGRQLHVWLADQLPLVPMDMVLMNQVLINLLDNALKYSPPESTVEITARCAQGMLELAVSDQGAGVPEQELDRIFEKFYRIAVPESVKGTGLGLSICHGIVEAHGGYISASNQPSGGLCVTVQIPLKMPLSGQENRHAE